MTRRSHPAWAVVAPLLAAGATFLMAYAFANGISAALSGDDGGSNGFVALFLLGGGVLVVAIVMAIVWLVRKRFRVLSILALVIAAVPVGTLLYLLVDNW
jgi:hypothetical protein